ncbi:MAG: 2-oxoacid:acceptor oxidoreductase subunit alpha [Clostridiales bacterium]|nr:2-oxoacid:acceptor oxidoreductase subunit alpha [Clostridiales bacterium]
MRKTIIIAGAAGEGINTVELYVEKLLKQEGYEIYAYKNYMSRVRGGYNYSTITIGQERVYSTESHADIFIALNAEAVENASAQIKADGTLIALSGLKSKHDFEGKIIWVDEEELKNITKNKNAFGMVAVGMIIKWFGGEESILEKINNKKWSDSINSANKACAKWGYEQMESVHMPARADEERIILNGNQAVALGALSAGLGFYCAYPMAPSTGIMNYLAAQEKKMNIVVEQAEDEIAAAMSAIGSASNGVRSMTGTSGGGFALMVESIGFAAVSEVPIVICNVQRPGPATGLPTRTEQADLAFVVTASQGEFARIVMAPRTVSDAYYSTFRAFNLAEKYQVPVIILSDQLLADSVQSIDRVDTSSLKIQRHLKEDFDPKYKRYDFENISGNRKYPGLDSQTLIMTDSHVHDEYGKVTESEEMTIALKNKFLNRIEAIKKELSAPEFYGSENYDTLFLSWGSTYGALREAVDELNSRGNEVAMISFTDVFPIRENVLEPFIRPDVRVINVEGNAMNQFGKILRMETGVKFSHSINRYDGRPFTSAFIAEAYEVIKND